MTERKKHFIIATTTRADWGLLSPLARALSLMTETVQITIAAGNTHLSERYGHTVDEIVSDGFNDVVELGMGADLSEPTEITADLLTSTAKLLSDRKADAVIILGDRYEMIGVATAALLARVPIVHIHGGEVSRGAIDDSVRNALSQMASLHLTATEQASQRLENMGIEPDRIVRVGAPGVENILKVDTLSLDELSGSLGGFEIDADRTLLVTYHPVTRHPKGYSTDKQLDNLLGALQEVPEANMIITYPNNDAESDEIIKRLERFASLNSARALLIKSLGRKRYLSALKYVKAVVGNSSSGLIEAPSTPAYTLDIGPRQDGRERASTVMHVSDDKEDIIAGLKDVLKRTRRTAVLENNPYFYPDTTRRAVEAIMGMTD